MEEQNASKGLSVASLILGILSMLCCCIGFPFAIIGIILAFLLNPIMLYIRKGLSTLIFRIFF